MVVSIDSGGRMAGPERIEKRVVTFIPFTEKEDGYYVMCPRDDESEGLSPVGGLCCIVIYEKDGKPIRGNLKEVLGSDWLDTEIWCGYCKGIKKESEDGLLGVFCDYNQPSKPCGGEE